MAGKYRKQKNAELSFGYAMEKFILYAASLGLGMVWLAATMDRSAFEKAIHMGADEVMPAVTPLGIDAEKRCVRESLMRRGMKSDSRLPFDVHFFRDAFTTPFREEQAGVWKLPMEMDRLAPSASNKQPWRAVVQGGRVHFHDQKTRGYAKESTGEIQKVDLGIALCHFQLAAQESGIAGSFIQFDPGIQVPEDAEYIATYVREV